MAGIQYPAPISAQPTGAPYFGDQGDAPIVQQPTQFTPVNQGSWNAASHYGFPRGVDYLTQVDQILVKQKIELLEVMTGYETNNKYVIKNSMGQDYLFAVEDTDCCARNCLGPLRPFDMKIYNNLQEEVIHLYRPCRCGGCCYPCCLQELEIMSPPGRVIGTVKQQWSWCSPKFVVEDANGNVVVQVEGPCCTVSCCSDVEFPVLTHDGSRDIGKITKQWSGFAREAYTDADNFGISFPMDLRLDVKVLLLGTLFLIDYMYFEGQNQRRR